MKNLTRKQKATLYWTGMVACVLLPHVMMYVTLTRD